MTLQRNFGWPYWSFFAVCLFLAALSHLISASLIGYYIEKHAPDLASRGEIVPGTEAWELTAGLGVVPKWVSWIGMLSIGFMLAMPFEIVANFVR